MAWSSMWDRRCERMSWWRSQLQLAFVQNTDIRIRQLNKSSYEENGIQGQNTSNQRFHGGAKHPRSCSIRMRKELHFVRAGRVIQYSFAHRKMLNDKSIAEPHQAILLDKHKIKLPINTLINNCRTNRVVSKNVVFRRFEYSQGSCDRLMTALCENYIWTRTNFELKVIDMKFGTALLFNGNKKPFWSNLLREISLLEVCRHMMLLQMLRKQDLNNAGSEGWIGETLHEKTSCLLVTCVELIERSQVLAVQVVQWHISAVSLLRSKGLRLGIFLLPWNASLSSVKRM